VAFGFALAWGGLDLADGRDDGVDAAAPIIALAQHRAIASAMPIIAPSLPCGARSADRGSVRHGSRGGDTAMNATGVPPACTPSLSTPHSAVTRC